MCDNLFVFFSFFSNTWESRVYFLFDSILFNLVKKKKKLKKILFELGWWKIELFIVHHWSLNWGGLRIKKKLSQGRIIIKRKVIGILLFFSYLLLITKPLYYILLASIILSKEKGEWTKKKTRKRKTPNNTHKFAVLTKQNYEGVNFLFSPRNCGVNLFFLKILPVNE